MKEIGGYLEYEENSSEMLYSDAIHLNCAKNCLVYLIKARDIKKIYIPYFLCDVVEKAYDMAFVNFDWGVSVAMSLLSSVIVITLLIIVCKLISKKVFYYN